MLMRKQMILTVFIVALTAGTVAEFQIRIVKLCPSTHRTSVDRAIALRTAAGISHIDRFLKLLLSVDLPRVDPAVISRHQEIDQHIHQ